MKKIKISFMGRAKTAFFSLSLLLSNVAISQLQPGDWCSSSLCNEGLYEFYDISGKHIFGGKIMNAEISTQNLQSGFYLLRLSNSTCDITKKVVIQK